MNWPVSVIIVTHNSAQVLPRCLEALDRQTMPVESIVIVDCGSTDTTYLERLQNKNGLVLLKTDNIGFGRANNLGLASIKQLSGMILFLNPDTFVYSDSIARASHILQNNDRTGAVTGKMLGFDPILGKPTDMLDSTGIFRKWYGRWYDRGQGESDTGRYDSASVIPAACGAFLFCRAEALMSLAGRGTFDEDFFLYKEDIELSLRLRQRGWQIIYDPALRAYHCRGWQKDRQQVPHSLRRMAAWNEVLLYRKHPSPYIIWAVLKYLLVKYLCI